MKITNEIKKQKAIETDCFCLYNLLKNFKWFFDGYLTYTNEKI